MRSRLVDIVSRVRSIGPVLLLIDPLAVVVAGSVVFPGGLALPLAAAALGALMVCRGSDLHRSRLVLSVIEDLPHLLLAAVVAVLALVMVSPVVGVGRSEDWYAIATFGLLSFGGMVLMRTATYALARVLRRARTVAHPVLIVGIGSTGRRLADTLIARREYGLAPVGMLDHENRHTVRGLPLPLVGDINDLDQAMTDLGVADVIFAFAGPPDQDMIATVRRCLDKDRQVFVVPRFHELMGQDHGRRTEMVRDIAVMQLRRRADRAYARIAQRTIDVVVSVGALVVLAPVLAVIAFAVRIETGPGVIFHQTRVGDGGRTFTTRKFTSLRPATFDADATSWDIDNDSRIGPVGGFLRRTGLDELPQLVDVMMGELSLVGPGTARPLTFTGFSPTTYAGQPLGDGLTADRRQVDRARDDSVEQVRFDNFSIGARSLRDDVKVTLRTLLGRRPAPSPSVRLIPADESRPDAGTPGTERELTGRRRG